VTTVTASDLREIEEFLAEPMAAAAERERRTFADQLQATDGTVVLFGAGRLGQLCARALARAGVPLRAFCDGNSRLRGSTVAGAEVMAPAEAARRFGGALFVVAIWTGTARESMPERLAFLRRLGCAHVTTYAPLVWAHGRSDTPFHAFDLPSRTLAAAARLRVLAAGLGDEASRRVLLAALRQRLHGVFDSAQPVVDQYFPQDSFNFGATKYSSTAARMTATRWRISSGGSVANSGIITPLSPTPPTASGYANASTRWRRRCAQRSPVTRLLCTLRRPRSGSAIRAGRLRSCR